MMRIALASALFPSDDDGDSDSVSAEPVSPVPEDGRGSRLDPPLEPLLPPRPLSIEEPPLLPRPPPPRLLPRPPPCEPRPEPPNPDEEPIPPDCCPGASEPGCSGWAVTLLGVKARCRTFATSPLCPFWT